MSPVWAVPVAATVMGGAALYALLKGTRDAARDLVAEIARFGEMHGALSSLRTEMQRAGDTVGRIRVR